MITEQTNTVCAPGAVIETQSAPPAAPPQDVSLVLPRAGYPIASSAREFFQAGAATGRFFRRGTSVVRAVGKGAGAKLDPLTIQSARSAFDSLGRIFRIRQVKNNLVPEPALITTDEASLLLSCAEAVEELPELVGSINVPVLAKTADGPRLCGSGYSPELKLWVFSGVDVPKVTIEEARASLLGLLEEFDFATESDKSRAFAAFLTPALHFGGWLDDEAVAMDVAEADKSQAGKTFRHRIVAAIYGDKPSYVNSKVRGVGGLEESFQSQIYEGKAFVSLDNAKVSLDSEYIEQTLTNTTGKYRVRLPGMKEVEVRAKFIVQLSANRAKMSRDLANRSSIVRIRKREGYVFRRNPETDVKARQGHYLGCVIAFIQEWVAHGCKQTTGVEHSFRKWAGVSDWIVQNIGGLAPLLDGHQAAQIRTSDPTRSFLREIAVALEGEGQLGDAIIVSQMIELASRHLIELTGLNVNPGTDEEKTSARRILGTKLAPVFKSGGDDLGGIDVDGYRITRIEDTRTRDGGSGPVKEYRYQFTRPSAQKGGTA